LDGEFSSSSEWPLVRPLARLVGENGA